ncbi:UNVERIFIED_CONTAM: hypothetical protein Slati_4300200 [Sesamum latifolium]|uniref:Uncharacterized protein n=1 Tax=Sesamum latifolium TaxID=2727402 RepID=A0AAW2TD12_9LAMI
MSQISKRLWKHPTTLKLYKSLQGRPWLLLLEGPPPAPLAPAPPPSRSAGHVADPPSSMPS